MSWTNENMSRTGGVVSPDSRNGGATIAQIPPRGDRRDQMATAHQPVANPNPSSATTSYYGMNHPSSASQAFAHAPFPSQPYSGPSQMNHQYHNMYAQQQQQPQYSYPWSNPQPSQQYPQTQQRPPPNYANSPHPQQYMPQNYPQQMMSYGQGGSNHVMPISMPARKKVTLKLVILGNSGVGKTSLMNRYHSNKFTGQYKATIGADFVSKQLTLPSSSSSTGASGQSVTLTIWDTAGQERFQSLGKAFYRGSDVCVLVYDVTDRVSFEGLQKWKEEFDSCLSGGSTSVGTHGGMMQNRLQNGSVVGEKLKFVVIANKADKDYASWSVAREEGMEYAKSIASEFFECSAKTALNVEEAFLAAAKAGYEYNTQKLMSMNASMMMQQGGGYSGMRGYVPPQRTVDLNRGHSSMSDEGDCC